MSSFWFSPFVIRKKESWWPFLSFLNPLHSSQHLTKNVNASLQVKVTLRLIQKSGNDKANTQRVAKSPYTVDVTPESSTFPIIANYSSPPCIKGEVWSIVKRASSSAWTLSLFNFKCTCSFQQLLGRKIIARLWLWHGKETKTTELYGRLGYADFYDADLSMITETSYFQIRIHVVQTYASTILLFPRWCYDEGRKSLKF